MTCWSSYSAHFAVTWRKGFFQGTRLQFMERGFPAVKRLPGYDLKGRDHSHLHGFDTFLKNLIPQGRVRLAHQSVAYQRGHRLQKRQ